MVLLRMMQIEAMRRWMQRMNRLAHGAEMAEEQVDQWEGLLSKTFIEHSVPAVREYRKECLAAVTMAESVPVNLRRIANEERTKIGRLRRRIAWGNVTTSALVILGLACVLAKELLALTRRPRARE